MARHNIPEYDRVRSQAAKAATKAKYLRAEADLVEQTSIELRAEADRLAAEIRSMQRAFTPSTELAQAAERLAAELAAVRATTSPAA